MFEINGIQQSKKEKKKPVLFLNIMHSLHVLQWDSWGHKMGLYQQLPILDSLEGLCHSFSCCSAHDNGHQEQRFIGRGMGSCVQLLAKCSSRENLRLSTLSREQSQKSIKFLMYQGLWVFSLYQVLFPAYPRL